MEPNKSSALFAAVWIVASLLATPTRAQELPLPTTTVEDTPVVLLPTGISDLSGASTTDGINVSVSMDQGLRTFRATYKGRTYTAHAGLLEPQARFAFDPAQRRFRLISLTIRVELYDYDDLDSIAQEQGAIISKAYPQLGFALIRLNPGSDVSGVVEMLAADRRVRRAHLQFERPRNRPMLIADRGQERKGSASKKKARLVANDAHDPMLFVAVMGVDFLSSDFDISVEVRNFGEGSANIATLRAEVSSIVSDDSTTDPNDHTFKLALKVDQEIPALDGDDVYRGDVSIPIRELDPGRTYLVELKLLDGDAPPDDAETLDSDSIGFSLDSLNRVRHSCLESGRGSVNGMRDPLLSEQWNLKNTGQSSYAENSGANGEDLQMGDVLNDGPTGAGVRVAVVDSGLEICHPDLKANIEEGASFNFNVRLQRSGGDPSLVNGMESSDPFNFNATGDHGSSVAGIIAADANNGIGIRGVAPSAPPPWIQHAQRAQRGLLDGLFRFSGCEQCIP